jgi:hypothetical protein
MPRERRSKYANDAKDTAQLASSLAQMSTNVKSFGAKGDGVTDDTLAVQNAINAVMGVNGDGAGGTVFFPSGTYLILGQLIIPNDGLATNPKQPSLRLKGTGTSANGRWLPMSEAASVLDLRVNATVAKIDTRGFGVLEIDHLILADKGSDGAPFIQTTNTTLRIHDCAFIGTSSGVNAKNDAIILGGIDATGHGFNLATSPFQGYGTIIRDNFFSQIRKCVLFRSAANNIQVVNNTVSNDCGSSLPDGAAIVLEGANPEQSRGNYIAGNLIEVTHYPYGIYLGGYANSNSLIGNGIWDRGENTLGAYNVLSGGNTIIGYTDNFGADKFKNASISNFLLDLANGGIYSNLPIVKTPIFMPIMTEYWPSNGEAVGVNNTSAVTHLFRAQSGTSSFTVKAPIVNSGSAGQLCTVVIRNTSGNTLNITWNSIYKISSWGSLADNTVRTITFFYDGIAWIETNRSADIPYQAN